jgi:hypothetical protein
LEGDMRADDPDALGRAAYAAFVDRVPEHNFMPPWGALSPEKREAWRAAGDAVRMWLRVYGIES